MKILFSFFFLFGFLSVTSAQKRDSTVVYFDFNKYGLTENAKTQTDQLIAQYKSSGGSHLQIRGFCDARGSNNYNDRLSDKRASSVQDYLLKNGIPATDIILKKGYGKRMPVNENHTEIEMQENRRVDLLWFQPEIAEKKKEDKPVATEIKTPEKISDFSKESIDSIKEGQTLRLKNINFYGGRHTFLPQALSPLHELLDVMKTNPGLVIEIQGHICCFFGGQDGADMDSNDMKLSNNRAKAVYDFLLVNGIDESRMSYQGFSGTRPLVYPERSEDDRTRNRRVEIRIIKK